MAKRKKTVAGEDSLSAAQRRVRDGDGAALEAWAGEVQAAGDAEAADVIRQLPGLRDYIAESLAEGRKLYPEVGVTLHHNSDRGHSYWYMGDWDIDESTEEYPKHWPRRMGQLLAGWNTFYPGVEWLARELGLIRVNRFSRVPPAVKETQEKVTLSAGEHLTPTEPGHEVLILCMAPSFRGKKRPGKTPEGEAG